MIEINMSKEIHLLLKVELCGHATLAAAHTLFTSGLLKCNTIEFLTQSGILTAKKVPDLKKSEPLKYENGEANERFFIELDFPATTIVEDDSVEVSSLHKALSGASALDIKKTTGHDFLVYIFAFSVSLQHMILSLRKYYTYLV